MTQHSILTFGSCLSRYVARSYKRLYAGDILASVYHNRSDYFLSTFIDRTQRPLHDLQLSRLEPRVNPDALDEDSRNIAHNQSAEGIGRHKLVRTSSLFETLKSERVDLILMDNFMDVAARLSTDRTTQESYFLRASDYLNFDDHFTVGGYLNPEVSALNFKRIVDFLHASAPQSRICMLQFPFNTYEGDEARRLRSLGFLRHFADERVISLPPQSVPRVYRTEVPSHFQEPQYAAYAGMVRALLTC